DNNDILFVGDSNVDMMTARNAGMTACGVSWGFRSREELMAAGADYIVEKAEEILDLLVK
ncbi:MAG TPA: HAD hydrolase-like protein, partial [Oscillospiraceae bacterium]|nr:HAD hydrolase-like protein [Oscillospiraceae bacterium]